MDLETTIKWTQKRVDELSDDKATDPNEMRANTKMLSWLEELLRYRLFYSEVINEIDQSDNAIFTKERLVKFLEEEYKEWQLEEVIP